jgi:hypothetical protein
MLRAATDRLIGYTYWKATINAEDPSGFSLDCITVSAPRPE